MQIEEYRTGRNFVRVGDLVKVKPIKGDRFEAKVKRLDADDTTGEIVQVHWVATSGKRRGKLGCSTPERIERMAQATAERKGKK